MNTYCKGFKVLCSTGLMLLSIASCRTTTGPNSPATPAGYIACFGHIHSYCVPMWQRDTSTAYAYWKEAPDSSYAVLLYAIDPAIPDSLFLIHDTSFFGGWKYHYSPADTSYSRASVVVTNDSVIEGSFGVDCGSYIYLKKLQ